MAATLRLKTKIHVYFWFLTTSVVFYCLYPKRKALTISLLIKTIRAIAMGMTRWHLAWRHYHIFTIRAFQANLTF